MKSLKIALKNCNYPLFIDSGLLNRVNEFCDLYRFPVNKIIVTTNHDSEKIQKFWHEVKNCEVILVPFEMLNSQLDSILKIFDYLPWEKSQNGITLIVVGEDWLIRPLAFAKQLTAFPMSIICVPTSFWSVLETGVNDSFYLNWKKNKSVFKFDYCPDLVLVDTKILGSQDSNDPLLGITVVLRHLLQVNPDIFHLFKSNIPEVFSNEAQENIQILEELVTSRLSLFQDEDNKKCLQEFGIRFLEAYRSQVKKMIPLRELAVMVLVDICWRWKISRDLKICTAKETDSIFSLIEKICLNNHLTSDEWNQGKNRILKIVSDDLLHDIYLPESIGKFKCVNNLNEKMVKQSLQNC